MIQKLFPHGKPKAFNVSYDDGVEQDVRFVELLNKYGLKGTFNLNSGLMKQRFTWIHETGMAVTRLSESDARELYSGHEVASHTWSHPYMDSLPETEILRELHADKHSLEQLFGRSVCGFAVPFLHYSDLIARCVKSVGFEYARISEESGNFSLPENDFYWRGGIFHWSEGLEEFVEKFLATDQELAFCQIVGHSYDLDTWNMWGRMEAVLEKVSRDADVCPVTTLEVLRYKRAMAQARITDEYIQNPSGLTLWFRVDGMVVAVPSGETFHR